MKLGFTIVMMMTRFLLLFAWLAFAATGSPSFAAKPPPPLRPGIECTDAEIATALALMNQGWEYVMPRPKSPQAMWGNVDGRTTWFVGYWTKKKSAPSRMQPARRADGAYVGDGQGGGGWRRGGSPPPPSRIEWLCSKSGGPPQSVR